jgi:hypothetical protein
MTSRLLVLVAALVSFACSACPTKGPRAVRIDPAFTPAQQLAIQDAVDAWDNIGLTVYVSTWDDDGAVPIARDDSIVTQPVPNYKGRVGLLGLTTVNTKHQGDHVQIAGGGTFPNGATVDQFDFYSTVAHELGHLYGLNSNGDPGDDGHGHLDNPDDLMYNGGHAGDPRRDISAEDATRVLGAVDKVWK